jgi:hypothetical protein
VKRIFHPSGSVTEQQSNFAAARADAAQYKFRRRSRIMTILNILGEISLPSLYRSLGNRKDVHSCLTRTNTSLTKTRLSNS